MLVEQTTTKIIQRYDSDDPFSEYTCHTHCSDVISVASAQCISYIFPIQQEHPEKKTIDVFVCKRLNFCLFIRVEILRIPFFVVVFRKEWFERDEDNLNCIVLMEIRSNKSSKITFIR